MDFTKELEEYFKNTPKEQIEKDWAKSLSSDNVGPTIEEFLIETKKYYKGMQVLNHKDFCHFKYDGPESNMYFQLGDVVFKESELLDEGNPIGVVIQIHPDGDCRTDMYGNIKHTEVRKATKEDVQEHRPEILDQCIDIQDIENNLDVQAIGLDASKAVLVKDLSSGFEAWIDVDVDNQDVLTDWNQYIFNLNTTKDLKARVIQSSCVVFDMFTSCAIDYLEGAGLLSQDEKGKWSWVKKEIR